MGTNRGSRPCVWLLLWESLRLSTCVWVVSVNLLCEFHFISAVEQTEGRRMARIMLDKVTNYLKEKKQIREQLQRMHTRE